MSIFSNLQVVHKTLQTNGLRTVVVPLTHLHSVTFSIFVGVGSRHETKELNGISHMLEHMVFRGTKKYPSPFELNYAIEALGGTLYGATHVDFTQYQLTLPPENLEKGFEILSEVLKSPVFKGLEIERNVIKEEILETLDENKKNIDVDEVMRATMFGNHPLSYPIAGTLESVDQIKEIHLRDHMTKFYKASNMVLCVAGAVDAERVLEKASVCFGGIEQGKPSIISKWSFKENAGQENSSQNNVGQFSYVQHTDSQTSIRLSYPTFGIKDPRYTALKLLIRVLDDGMSTRLHQRIVDQKGLAYEVFADTDAFEDCGMVDFGVTVAHEKVEETLGEILHLLSDLRKVKIPSQELQKAKTRYLWSLREMLDSDEAMVGYFGIDTLFEMNDSIEDFEQEIQKVTSEDLLTIANEVFKEKNAYLACVGDISSLNKKEIEKLFSSPIK